MSSSKCVLASSASARALLAEQPREEPRGLQVVAQAPGQRESIARARSSALAQIGARGHVSSSPSHALLRLRGAHLRLRRRLRDVDLGRRARRTRSAASSVAPRPRRPPRRRRRSSVRRGRRRPRCSGRCADRAERLAQLGGLGRRLGVERAPCRGEALAHRGDAGRRPRRARAARFEASSRATRSCSAAAAARASASASRSSRRRSSRSAPARPRRAGRRGRSASPRAPPRPPRAAASADAEAAAVRVTASAAAAAAAARPRRRRGPPRRARRPRGRVVRGPPRARPARRCAMLAVLPARGAFVTTWAQTGQGSPATSVARSVGGHLGVCGLVQRVVGVRKPAAASASRVGRRPGARRCVVVCASCDRGRRVRGLAAAAARSARRRRRDGVGRALQLRHQIGERLEVAAPLSAAASRPPRRATRASAASRRAASAFSHDRSSVGVGGRDHRVDDRAAAGSWCGEPLEPWRARRVAARSAPRPPRRPGRSPSTCGRSASRTSRRAAASSAAARASSSCRERLGQPDALVIERGDGGLGPRDVLADDGQRGVEPLVAEDALEHRVARRVGRRAGTRRTGSGRAAPIARTCRSPSRAAARCAREPALLSTTVSRRGVGVIVLEASSCTWPCPLRRIARVTRQICPSTSNVSRTCAASASWWMSERVSRCTRGVLPNSANATASRIVDLPAPIGPTMPTSRRPRKSNVTSSR